MSTEDSSAKDFKDSDILALGERLGRMSADIDTMSATAANHIDRLAKTERALDEERRWHRRTADQRIEADARCQQLSKQLYDMQVRNADLRDEVTRLRAEVDKLKAKRGQRK